MINYCKINGREVFVTDGEYNKDGDYEKRVLVDHQEVGTITNWIYNDKTYGVQTHIGYLFRGVELKKLNGFLEPVRIERKQFESLKSLANWIAGCKIIQMSDIEPWYAIRVPE